MLQLTVNNENKYTIETTDETVLINGKSGTTDIEVQPGGLISILHNNKSYTGILESLDVANKTIAIRIDGKLFTTTIEEPIDLLLSNMGINLSAMKKAEPIKAPMPGLVIKILVTEGQKVEKGDGLIILEAMKMENILKATGPATVKAIKAVERNAVEKGAILIEME